MVNFCGGQSRFEVQDSYKKKPGKKNCIIKKVSKVKEISITNWKS